MRKTIENLLLKNNLNSSEEIVTKFDTYFNLLIEWNKKFNLTRITEVNDVAEKHFLDSILPEKLIPKDAKIIDIGAGAGFPSIPLKIYRPDLKITMVDSLNKRITFLLEVVSALHLDNCIPIHSRSEDLAHNEKYREKFDVAIARAVAPLNILVEYALPFIHLNGYFLAYKQFDCEEELETAKKAIDLLGGKVEKIYEYSTSKDIKRKIILIKKIKPSCAKFPRGKNQPKTTPIV